MIAWLQIHWVPVLAVAGLLTTALGVVWLWCLARRCWRGTPAVGRDVGLGVLDQTQETPRRRHARGRRPDRRPVVPVRHPQRLGGVYRSSTWTREVRR